MRARLGALPHVEVGRYVHFRMRAAGADHEIFSSGAIDRIAKLTKGIPRAINVLAAGALYVGLLRGMKSVTPLVVDQAHGDIAPADGEVETPR